VDSPPYQQIAEDLRRRVESGALQPGARVPSTRALARRWKVANATAAHALKVLIHEGVLTALPRSGTVVAERSAPGELSLPRILSAAVRMADAEGLAALSIRGLSAKLGVPVMSLYRHVRSKDELFTLMADAALGEERLPEPPPKGWRAQLEIAARAEWRVMRRHPWLARVVHISRPHAAPSSLAFADWVMRALDGSRLDAAGKLKLHVVMHGFVQGLAVNVEAEEQAAGDTGISEAEHMHAEEARFAALAATGRYPFFAKMMQGISPEFDLRFDELFEMGLAALLDGFAPLIEGKRRR
jgi:DNA-binding transcriptional regulator YhcF (GntR family)